MNNDILLVFEVCNGVELGRSFEAVSRSGPGSALLPRSGIFTSQDGAFLLQRTNAEIAPPIFPVQQRPTHPIISRANKLMRITPTNQGEVDRLY